MSSSLIVCFVKAILGIQVLANNFCLHFFSVSQLFSLLETWKWWPLDRAGHVCNCWQLLCYPVNASVFIAFPLYIYFSSIRMRAHSLFDYMLIYSIILDWIRLGTWGTGGPVSLSHKPGVIYKECFCQAGPLQLFLH